MRKMTQRNCLNTPGPRLLPRIPLAETRNPAITLGLIECIHTEVYATTPIDWNKTYSGALTTPYEFELLLQNEACLERLDDSTMKKLLILWLNLERKEFYNDVDDICPSHGDDDITDKKQGEKKGKVN